MFDSRHKVVTDEELGANDEEIDVMMTAMLQV